MLSLKNISKVYQTGGERVDALKDVSLDFRTSEFVSILGPSGGGKTTLLNIIGGLDKYTSGDLIINGKSTKNYRDRDWDSYRNHSVGFVFQSYNLIPHQSVLQNVELALTLSGVSASQRRKKAKEALEAVGLGDQIRKRPNQMSGGQMQRVAIARAIVNDPDIILADEPTGALDTQTSIQVMEILKKISKDRLVVMVTHNPELADQYSTRIVRLRDGQIIDDSAPLTAEELEKEKEKDRKASTEKAPKKPSMSLMTSFGLSFKNLLSKKARTILTSFAGSIGIIGIGLIYAVSQGTSNYIDSIQEDTLSTYPLTITSESADMTSVITAFGTMLSDKTEAPENTLVEKQVMGQVFAQVGKNDLKELKAYIDGHYDEVDEYINEIKYSYGITPRVYTYDVTGKVLRVNPTSIFSGYYMGSSVFNEMITNRELLDSQYDMLAGRWPEKYNEMVFVLTDKGTMTDYMAYCIGLLDSTEISDMMEKVNNAEPVELRSEPLTWTYQDLLDLDLRLVPAYKLYKYVPDYGVWENMATDEKYVEDLVEKGERLRITGVVVAKEGVSASALGMGINYMPELILHIISDASGSDVVADQLKNPEKDVFSGKTFEELKNEQNNDMNFENLITVDTEAISSAFGFNVNYEQLTKLFSAYIGDLGNYINTSTKPAYDLLHADLVNISRDMLLSYIEEHTDDEGYCTLKTSDRETYAGVYIAKDRAKALYQNITDEYDVTEEDVQRAFTPILNDLIAEYLEDITEGQPEVRLKAEEIRTGIDDKVRSFISRSDITTAHQGYLMALAGNMTIGKLSEEIESAISGMTQRLVASLPSALAMNIDGAKIASAFRFNMTQADLQRLMTSYSGNTSSSSCDGNLRRLGYSALDTPNSISVYMKDFTAKNRFIKFLDDYNDLMKEQGLDDRVISYTDTTGLLMSSVKTIVDSVSYVLIAFVSISLIVSSIMIGVITLISVQERTKEIGILRAIGASKRNVSSMFNAETVMIGLTSGLVGIGITYLLCIPINKILFRLTNNASLKAVLPPRVALILVIISVTMTLISGIIPSRSAAKKDPVVALRTE